MSACEWQNVSFSYSLFSKNHNPPQTISMKAPGATFSKPVIATDMSNLLLYTYLREQLATK